VSYQRRRFEVPLGLTGTRIRLVVDPHSEQVIAVERHDGEPLGPATARSMCTPTRAAGAAQAHLSPPRAALAPLPAPSRPCISATSRK